MHYFVGLGDSKTENSTGSSLLGDLDDLFSAVTQQNSVSYKISFCRLTLPDCQIMITFIVVNNNFFLLKQDMITCKPYIFKSIAVYIYI